MAAGANDRWIDKWGRALQNALEVARLEPAGTRFSSPYTVVRRERVYTLRRYQAANVQPRVQKPVLLVPALMITSDIYDIEADASAVAYLTSQGIDTWLVDFGVPEAIEGGLSRTQDDHVAAVNESIDVVREVTGQDVHLTGYSQGGMFNYQAAAWRRSEGIASLITMGSLVDLHANLPLVDRQLLGRYLRFIREGALSIIDHFESLPAPFIRTIFKLISVDKRLVRFAGFVRDLHDRQAIERGAGKRRFLGGEGFVAWPGPAFTTFADEIVVNNRLLEGGFVVNGRAASLADVDVPLLCFYGERDDIARPACVLAIRDAAPNAQIHEVSVPVGHIGLVMSQKAFEISWPTVVQWCRWHEGLGPRPEILNRERPRDPVGEALEGVRDRFELFKAASHSVASGALRRAMTATDSALALTESLRFQVARLAQLDQMEAGTRVSLGKALADRAARNPKGAFFIYDGRGQSFAEADYRVHHVVRGLIACGVRRGQHVGVLMNNRPSYLSLVTAVSRLGAVSVLLSPSSERASLDKALAMAPVDVLVADPDNVVAARRAFAGQLLMLGAPRSPRPSVEGVVDMEAIDTERVELPDWYEPNPGRADDLAMIMFTAGRYDEPRAARITNMRWAVGAYGAAAAASLSARDTVYAAMPLHHASGMLVSVGGALVGAARLALTSEFSPQRFWSEVRRYNATVVFYAGEMLRELVDAPAGRDEPHHPIRLFAGSGMRRDIWQRLRERFGPVGVLEFYASTEGPGVLANVSGEKVGSLGRPLPGSNDMFVATYDFGAMRAVRDINGLALETGDNEPGLLVTRVDENSTRNTFEGYVDLEESERRLLHDVREHGDSWFITGDIVRRDPDGDYWFCDRLSDVVHSQAGPLFSRVIEDTIYAALPEVKWAVVYPSGSPGRQQPGAALVLREDAQLTAERATRVLRVRLDRAALPRHIHLVDALPHTDGYRPMKTRVRERFGSEAELAQLVWDETAGCYVCPDELPRAAQGRGG